jgi:hypothetical protein
VGSINVLGPSRMKLSTAKASWGGCGECQKVLSGSAFGGVVYAGVRRVGFSGCGEQQ